LDLRPLRQVDLAVVLRLQCRVAGVEGREEGPAGGRHGRIGEFPLEVRPLSQVQEGQSIADDDVAVLPRGIEAGRELRDEARIALLPDRPYGKCTQRHMRRRTVASRSATVKFGAFVPSGRTAA